MEPLLQLPRRVKTRVFIPKLLFQKLAIHIICLLFFKLDFQDACEKKGCQLRLDSASKAPRSIIY